MTSNFPWYKAAVVLTFESTDEILAQLLILLTLILFVGYSFSSPWNTIEVETSCKSNTCVILLGQN